MPLRFSSRHRAGKAKAITPVRPRSVTGTDRLRTSLVRFPGQAAFVIASPRSKAFLWLPYEFPARPLGKPLPPKLANDRGLLRDHTRTDAIRGEAWHLR